MPIAGTVIVINSQNQQQAQEIALAIRDLEKEKSYCHVGQSVLTEHFLPKHCHQMEDYAPALYGALSGTARCGADIVADLTITTEQQYQTLAPFIQDLDIVWVNIGFKGDFVKHHLLIEAGLIAESAAKKILDFIKDRYNRVNAFARFAPEVSPVPQAKQPGKIVMLIGASSAGKSTLSSAVQDTSNETFLNVGIDTAVFHYLHLRYMSGVPTDELDESWKESNFTPTDYQKIGASWIAPGPNDKNPHPHMRFQVGRVTRQAMSAMYATMAEISRLGFNVISDQILFFNNALAEAKHRFKGLPTVYVSLCPKPEVIVQREQQRGDRMSGIGMSVYHQMIQDLDADIVLDTGVYTPEDGAKIVLDFLKKQKLSHIPLTA